MYNLGTYIFLFLFIPLLVKCGYNVPFEDCGSIFYLESIKVSNCETYPCRLIIGSMVNVTTNLLIQGSGFNTDELEQKVYFVVSKIQLEVSVTPDPCEAARGTNHTSCNINSGERVAYEATLIVQNVPPLPATLHWSIKNKTSQIQVVCYKINVLLMTD